MKKLKLALIVLILSFSFSEFSVKAAEYFTVNVVGENFCVYITDPTTLALAYRDARGEIRRIVIGIVRTGNDGYNQPWSWHLDPDTVRLAEMTVEVCDGRPSYVEQHLPDWLNKGFCPWTSDIIRVGCPNVITTTTTTILPQPTTTSIRRPLRGAGGSRWAIPLGATDVLNDPLVILVALIAIVVIIYGAFKFFAMPKKHI
jgi:hypothetical protein